VRCGDQRGADRRVGSQSGRPPLAQTERLKAALARYRRTGEDAERAETAAAYAGLLKYFETPARGAWRDKLKADKNSSPQEICNRGSEASGRIGLHWRGRACA